MGKPREGAADRVAPILTADDAEQSKRSISPKVDSINRFAGTETPPIQCAVCDAHAGTAVVYAIDHGQAGGVVIASLCDHCRALAGAADFRRRLGRAIAARAGGAE